MSLQRPPHVDPQWWARASWRARQAAVTAHRRDHRPPDTSDEERINALRARVEAERIAHEARYRPHIPTAHKAEPSVKRAAQVEQLLDAGYQPVEVVAQLGIKPGSVVRALERAGRTELAAPFEKLRREERRHLCPGCRVLICAESKSCRACNNRNRGRKAA